MSTRIGNLGLEEILLGRGLVKSEDLTLLASPGSGPSWLVDRLVGAGLVTEEQVARALSEELGCPFVTTLPHQIDPVLVRGVPAHLLWAHRALPLLAETDTVDVAFADPLDSRGVALVARALKRRVRPAVATSSTILACLREALGAEDAAASLPQSDAHWEASGAIRLYSLLLTCIEESATELLLVPTSGGGLVRLRRFGVLVERETLDASLMRALTARLKALVDLGTGAVNHRGYLTARIGGLDLHLSIAVVPTEQGEAASVGIEPEHAGGTSGPGTEALQRLTAFLATGEGLVVVNSLQPEAGASLVRKARRASGRAVEQWVCCGDGMALDVGAAMRLRAQDFATGFAGAVSAARTLHPDVLVLVPRPGALPPAEALLGARDGRRTVLLGAWGDARETVEALAGVGLPAGTLAQVLRGVLTLHMPTSGLDRQHVECSAPFDAEENATARCPAAGGSV